MGKKATLLLTHILFEVATLVVFCLTILAWFGGTVSPSQSWFIAFMSLGMLPLLVTNLIILVIWAFKKSFLALLPLGALILNFGFISSMYNVDLRSQDKIPPTELTIATYNLHGFTHENFNKTLLSISNYMKNRSVDIFCMQEFVDKPDPSIDSLLAYFPYRVVVSKQTGMQLAIFSRYPITDSKLIPFSDSFNCAMWADVDVEGRMFRVFNIHFQTTNINQSKSEILKVKDLGIEDPQGKQAFDVVMGRLSDNASKRAEQVTIVRNEIDKSTDRLHVVCGDFNDTPASFAYHHIKQGLYDGFKTCGSGYAYTFKPIYHLFRLDYIFYSKNLQGVNYQSPDAHWSDHNPVILELAFVK